MQKASATIKFHSFTCISSSSILSLSTLQQVQYGVAMVALKQAFQEREFQE